ncbi:hypothetical protein RFN25_30080 [Mesorhizobium abyssinicae]|uniref:hypothetical protein n=1 Tax=Mesorhizobium abyssinicae TaxID=1209958 RepID=UPI002A249D1F|nr:hypothetical protein [Mesorhizobium abyssinicae]MDX8437655.1 hypothetical protein [Mesorhizobium abyssinicae]
MDQKTIDQALPLLEQYRAILVASHAPIGPDGVPELRTAAPSVSKEPTFGPVVRANKRLHSYLALEPSFWDTARPAKSCVTSISEPGCGGFQNRYWQSVDGEEYNLPWRGDLIFGDRHDNEIPLP